jgi:hypothetical protein
MLNIKNCEGDIMYNRDYIYYLCLTIRENRGDFPEVIYENDVPIFKSDISPFPLIFPQTEHRFRKMVSSMNARLHEMSVLYRFVVFVDYYYPRRRFTNKYGQFWKINMTAVPLHQVPS